MTSRRATRSVLHAGLGAALLLLALAGSPALAQGLRVGVPTLPAGPDPATAAEGSALLIARQVFDTLVRYREGSSDVEPGLATSWTVSRDGATWSFRLRDGVRFSDGTPLTAQHVAASLERQLFVHAQAPEGAAVAPRLFRGAPGVVQAVKVPDARTVRIILVQPYAAILTVLAHPALGVAQVTMGADGRASFVGSGPFVLAELGGGRAVLDAHPGHWAGPPPVGRVVLMEYADARRAEADLDARQLHLWMPAGPPTTLAGALSVPGWRLGYLAANTEREPLSRRKVRQAIAAALGGGVIAPALGAHGVPVGSFLPPGVWARTERAAAPPGPAEVRKLLVESGIGRPPPMSIAVAGLAPPLDASAIAQAVRAACEAAGLPVRVRPEPPEAAHQLAQRAEHDLVLAEALAEGGDPHLLLYPLSTTEGAVKGSAVNLSFFRQPRLDDLLIRASQVSFRPERERVYARAQALLAEELPWIPLYARLHWVVARPEVRNLRLHPSGAHRLDRVTLSP